MHVGVYSLFMGNATTALTTALEAYRAHVTEDHHEVEVATALDLELSELLGAMWLADMEVGS